MRGVGKLLAGATMVTIAAGVSTPSLAQTATAATGNPAPVAPAAQDDGKVEDIVVTAERHSVNLQKAPLTIAVLSGSDLEGTAIASYRDALVKTNNVVVQGVSNSDSPTPTIAIRGLGTDGGSRTQATAVYVDGVIVNNANLQFYDLSRVEVLSGPQATLYGGVATAGAVNVISNNPSFDRIYADARLGYGAFNQLTYGGMVNIPLSDTLSLRAALNGQQRDNYWGKSGDGRSEVNGRVKLLFQPTENFSVLLGGETYHFSGNIGEALSFQDANGNMGRPVPLKGSGHINDNKVYAQINYRFDWANLTSISAFQQSDTHVVFQGVPFAPINPVFTSGSDDSPYQNQVTEEVRLSSNSGSSFTWVTGFYFQRTWRKQTNGSDSSGVIPLRDPAPVIFFQTIDVTQYHPFAQVTYPITPGIRLTGGLSYDSYEINYPQDQTFPAGPYPISNTTHYDYDKTFHSLDGIARVEADLSPKNLVYASFSTGFRPGGPGGGTPESFYGVERVRAFEVGSKNRFLDDRLQANVSVYYYNFPSFQNQTNTLDNNGNPHQGTVVIPAKLYGVELSLDAKLSPRDTLSFKGAYEHARYQADYPYAGFLTPNGPFAPGVLVNYTIPSDGARLTHAPDLTLGADYSHEFRFGDGSNLLFNGSMRYTSSQPVTFDVCTFSEEACAAEGNIFTGLIYKPQYTQGGYTLFNASLTYTSANGRYSVTGFGRNLSNVLYKTNTTFGLANPGDPRTYGAQLSVKF